MKGKSELLGSLLKIATHDWVEDALIVLKKKVKEASVSASNSYDPIKASKLVVELKKDLCEILNRLMKKGGVFCEGNEKLINLLIKISQDLEIIFSEVCMHYVKLVNYSSQYCSKMMDIYSQLNEFEIEFEIEFAKLAMKKG